MRAGRGAHIYIYIWCAGPASWTSALTAGSWAGFGGWCTYVGQEGRVRERRRGEREKARGVEDDGGRGELRRVWRR